jgi:hypothetical protein
MLDPARAEGIDATIGFRLSDGEYRGRLHDGVFDIERGPAEGSDLVWSGAPPVIAGAVYGGVPLEILEREGALRIDGDRALAERFLTLFPLPPKVGAEA